jgi:hypothetical protein
MNGSPTRDFHSIYNAPMLGAHNWPEGTAIAALRFFAFMLSFPSTIADLQPERSAFDFRFDE